MPLVWFIPTSNLLVIQKSKYGWSCEDKFWTSEDKKKEHSLFSTDRAGNLSEVREYGGHRLTAVAPIFDDLTMAIDY